MVKRLHLFLILFLAAGGFFSSLGPCRADDSASAAAPTTVSSPLFLAQVKNKVTIIHEGASRDGNPPELLEPNDRVVTGSDGKAELQFQDGGVVEVGPKSDVKISQLEVTPKSFKARFLLAYGKFKAKVKKLTGASSSFEVEAGGVVAGVRGTVFGVDYDQDTKKVSAQTFEGSIFTKIGGKEEVVDKGFSMVVQKTGLPIRSPLTGQQVTSFKDFTDVSGILEKKKDEMINQLRQKATDKVKQGVQDKIKGKAGDEINKHLPGHKDNPGDKNSGGADLGGFHIGF